jgi:hypothetical protein
VPPLILTLAVAPSYAKAGSLKDPKEKDPKEKDPKEK